MNRRMAISRAYNLQLLKKKKGIKYFIDSLSLVMSHTGDRLPNTTVYIVLNIWNSNVWLHAELFHHLYFNSKSTLVNNFKHKMSFNAQNISGRERILFLYCCIKPI